MAIKPETKILKVVDGTKVIKEGSFCGSFISDIILPKGLLMISSESFKNNLIKEVFIPESVVYICHDAFDENVVIVRGDKKYVKLKDLFINIKDSYEFPEFKVIQCEIMNFNFDTFLCYNEDDYFYGKTLSKAITQFNNKK